jgi:hypothetical protein
MRLRFRGLEALSVAALFAMLGTGGCVHAVSQGDEGNAAESTITFVRVAAGQVDAVYAAGARVQGRRGKEQPARLATPINTLLVGTLAPAVVPERGGGRIAYNSWQGQRPVVRVRDAGGGDSVLAEGAHSPAWRQDGAIAYFQALKADLQQEAQAIRRYRGHVVVRASPDSSAVRWTTRADRYVVAAWAGQRLLVYRIREGWPDLLVLDRSGRMRLLSSAAALVAVAPDGGRAFVSMYGAEPAVVRVLDVARGRERARLTLAGSPIEWVIESGSWARGRVFATASVGVGVFRVRERRIELAHVLRFPVDVVHEPQSTDGRRLVAWGGLPSRPREAVARAAVFDCDSDTRRCVRELAGSEAAPPRLVYNPSRP